LPLSSRPRQRRRRRADLGFERLFSFLAKYAVAFVEYHARGNDVAGAPMLASSGHLPF
jgi:hypothetical protein